MPRRVVCTSACVSSSLDASDRQGESLKPHHGEISSGSWLWKILCLVFPTLKLLGQKRPKHTLKEIQGPPTVWSFFSLGGIQHRDICLKISLLGVACVSAVTGTWRGICAWKWSKWQDKLVVLHSSEGLLSRTVTKMVAWDVRHITQYLQLFLGQGLRQELHMKLPFPLNTVL